MGFDINKLASIATLLTALLGLFNVFVLRKQNKQALKPELMLVEEEFTFFWSVSYFEDLLIPIRCFRLDEFKSFDCYVDKIDYMDKRTNALYVPMVNIGKESAKDIIIEWDFDYMDIINQIKELDKNNEFSIEVNLSKSGKKDIVFVKKIDGKIGFGIDIVEKTHIKYIQPTGNENKPHKVYIPKLFVILHSTLGALLLKGNNISSLDYWRNIELDICIRYKDIVGNKYSSKNSIKLSETSGFKCEEKEGSNSRAYNGDLIINKTK